MTKKILAMFLAVLMVVSVMSTSVLAQETTEGEQTYYCPAAHGFEHTKENCETYDETAENEAYRPITVAPTCEERGYTLLTCKGCNEQFPVDQTEKLPHSTFVATEDQAATCTKPGYSVGAEVCKDCGAVVKGEAIAALNHEKDGKSCWVTDGAYDCENAEDGKLHQKCTLCGETRTVESKGQHTWKWELTKPATATENGTAHGVCTVCGKETDIVVYRNHNCSECLYKVDAVAATCTTDGTAAYYKCAVCEKLYSDVEAKNQIQKPATVSKTGHSPRLKGLTCADIGKEVYCENCYQKLTYNKENFGVDHEWKKVDKHESNKAPTCTEAGNQHWQCSVCEKEKDEPIDALGHDPIVDVKATCTTAGKWHCSRCDLKDVPIEATGHKLYTVEIPSTCKIAGYSYQICLNENCTLSSESTWKVGNVEYALTNIPVLKLYNTSNLCAYYFTGKLNDSGFYGALSTKMADAVLLRTESVILLQENKQLDRIATRLYFVDDNGVKYYIGMKASVKNAQKGTYYYNFAIDTNPEAEGIIFDFDWDAQYGIYTLTAENGTKLFMGTFGTNEDIRFCDYDTYVSSNYLAKVGVQMESVHLYVERDEEGNVTNTPVTVLEKNPNGHEFEVTSEVLPTCTEDGKAVICCRFGCGEIRKLTEGYEALGHHFGTYVTHDQTTITYECDNRDVDGNLLCDHTQKVVKYTDGAANSIHVWDDGVWVPALGTDKETHNEPNHLCHEMTKLYTCKTCQLTKTEDIHWEHCCDKNESGYVYEDLDSAKAEHLKDGGEFAFKGISETGTCYQKEVRVYECSICRQYVSVYNVDDGNNGLYGQHKWGVATEGPLARATIGGAENLGTRDYCEIDYDGWTAPADGTYIIVLRDKDGKVLTIGTDADETTKYFAVYQLGTDDKGGETAVNTQYNIGKITVIKDEIYYFENYYFEEDVTVSLMAIVRQEPTCVAPGYDYVVGCTRKDCDCYDKDAGKYEELPIDENAHHFVKNENICGGANGFTDLPEDWDRKSAEEKAQWMIDNNLYYDKCDNCDEQGNMCNAVHYYEPKVLAEHKAEYLCTDYTYYIYKCNCGDIHALYYYGNFGHKEYLSKHKDSTCCEDGYNSYECWFCHGQKRTETIERKPHWNEAGIPFWCIDGIEDTECVECDKDLSKLENKIYAHKWVWQGHWDATCVEDAFDLYKCACGEQHHVWDEGTAKGHTKPANEADYLENVKPTADKAGYIKYICTICGKEVTEKITGVVSTITNANGDDSNEYTYASLIKVTLSLDDLRDNNGKSIAPWSYRVEYTFNNEIIKFVGYKSLNENFNIVATDYEQANKDGKIEVLGYAENTDEGKTQGIVLGEHANVVELYFRVVANDSTVAELKVSKVTLTDANQVAYEFDQINGNSEATIVPFMDVNDSYKNGIYTVNDADLLAAVKILTGERSDRLTYDVCADIDGDGVITAEDILAMAELLVNDIDLENDILRARITEEEAKILHLDMYHCSHAGCTYESLVEFKFCPDCGTPYELLH